MFILPASPRRRLFLSRYSRSFVLTSTQNAVCHPRCSSCAPRSSPPPIPLPAAQSKRQCESRSKQQLGAGHCAQRYPLCFVASAQLEWGADIRSLAAATEILLCRRDRSLSSPPPSPPTPTGGGLVKDCMAQADGCTSFVAVQTQERTWPPASPSRLLSVTPPPHPRWTSASTLLRDTSPIVNQFCALAASSTSLQVEGEDGWGEQGCWRVHVRCCSDEV
ncbi:hypothetical protein R3P38DRAFT_3440449 [Favolaschia claudopus]|uniref:Uncharacterized protein n=1 Tax=Favolaschia claudopus TaxID=2862362 RepID=A0AAW0CWS2_9AGAR